jgi:adenylate cyclase
MTQPQLRAGVVDSATPAGSSDLARQMAGSLEELLLTSFRHHFWASTLAMFARNTELLLARGGFVADRERPTSAIAFVDLSGFTHITEAEGDDVGTSMAERLVEVVETAAAAHEASIVKLMGDGVMLHGEGSSALVATAMELVTAIPEAGLPAAHAGVHAGPVIERDGDYFGRTVNLAARIASEASPGEVLVSEVVAKGSVVGLRMIELPARRLRGFPEPVPVFRVERVRA